MLKWTPLTIVVFDAKYVQRCVKKCGKDDCDQSVAVRIERAIDKQPRQP